MSTIFDAAKYILEQKGSMLTLKLQKLCYYAQAWSLVWDEQPLFEEDFEAWESGPICPELYDPYKNVYVNSADDMKQGDSSVFNATQKETLDAVLDFYGDREPYWLRELTRMEDPWKKARGDCRMGEKCNTIITKRSMCEYYAGLDESSTIVRIAEWFLSKAPMSYRKLQALCYYAYAWYIVFFNDAEAVTGESDINTLCDDVFEAWIFGPTCRRLRDRYGKYGGNNIPKEVNAPAFDDDIEDLLQQAWDVYGSLSADQLEHLMRQEGPWNEAREGVRFGDACTNPISPLAIFQYYSREQQEWEKEQGAVHAQK